ncbi:MAG: DUF6503 family protein [Bacteroidota bacterium]
MRCAFFLVLSLSYGHLFSQKLTGTEVLERSIAYHDPQGQWSTFQGSFTVTMQSPKSVDRISTIHFDMPKATFGLDVQKGEDQYRYVLSGNECEITLNGKKTFSASEQKKFQLNCERGNLMKDYYTYLYGLPMKLKDPGTLVNDNIEKKQFKGKEYWVLQVNYEKNVGSDVWYFYFNPVSYALECYQFYHDETKNDGEYILLNGVEAINGIKMPKDRAWYYNKDSTYLGTDILTKAPL